MDTRLSASDSQLDSYILSHIEAEPDYLYRLYRESNIRLIHGHMVSGHLQGRLPCRDPRFQGQSEYSDSARPDLSRLSVRLIPFPCGTGLDSLRMAPK